MTGIGVYDGSTLDVALIVNSYVPRLWKSESKSVTFQEAFIPDYPDINSKALKLMGPASYLTR